MIELVDLARGREIHLGLDLNEDAISQASLSPLVCPITTKSKHPFGVYNFGCDEHAIFYGYIAQGVTFQHQRTSSEDKSFLLL